MPLWVDEHAGKILPLLWGEGASRVQHRVARMALTEQLPADC